MIVGNIQNIFAEKTQVVYQCDWDVMSVSSTLIYLASVKQLLGSRASVVDEVPKSFGCCRVVLVDTPLQWFIEITSSTSGLANQGGGSHL